MYDSDVCRLYKKVDDSIDHIVNGSNKLSEEEYKMRLDSLIKVTP